MREVSEDTKNCIIMAVRKLKYRLDNNLVEFKRHEIQYIEAAYEQLGRGIMLSAMQEYAISVVFLKNRKAIQQ